MIKESKRIIAKRENVIPGSIFILKAKSAFTKIKKIKEISSASAKDDIKKLNALFENDELFFIKKIPLTVFFIW